MYWTARTMYDVERRCGCSECVIRPVYDSDGNTQKKFSSKNEAEIAAREECKQRNDDRWGVTGPLD